MINRRKAMIGYLVYTAAKPLVKRAARSKAKAAVPGRREESRVPSLAVIAGAVAALVGALVFWRRRRGESEETFES